MGGGNVRNTTPKCGSVQLSRIWLIRWCVRVSTQAGGKAGDKDWKENVKTLLGSFQNHQFLVQRCWSLPCSCLSRILQLCTSETSKFFQHHLRTVSSNLLVFATAANDSMYKDALAHTLFSEQEWALGICIMFLGW